MTDKKEILEKDPGFVNIANDHVNTYSINAAIHVPGIEKQKVFDLYTEWAHKYDQDLSGMYRGPHIIASFIDILYVNKDIRILDIGAGTGRAYCYYYYSKNTFKINQLFLT
jgi:predicted TPR repeat methyltransferase